MESDMVHLSPFPSKSSQGLQSGNVWQHQHVFIGSLKLVGDEQDDRTVNVILLNRDSPLKCTNKALVVLNAFYGEFF
jgi:hypothetical protein